MNGEPLLAARDPGATFFMVAKLIVTSGKSAGRAISLKAGKLLMGRAEECDIRPLGEEVSRRHCSVVATDAEMTVEDLKSRNGTYVNGTRIAAKTVVADGDILRVGPLELKISFAVPAAAVPESAAPAAAGAPAAAMSAAVKKVDADGDEVSRWLMADDEPAGMFDTTQSVRAASTADSGCMPTSRWDRKRRQVPKAFRRRSCRRATRAPVPRPFRRSRHSLPRGQRNRGRCRRVPKSRRPTAPATLQPKHCGSSSASGRPPVPGPLRLL